MVNLSNSRLIAILVYLALGVLSCQSIKNEIEFAFQKGEFSKAKDLIENEILESAGDSLKIENLKSRLEIMDRLRLEFSLSEENARLQLSKYYLELTDSMMESWEKSGDLEMSVIDGVKWYFNRSVSNFFRVNKEAKALKDSIDGKKSGGVDRFQCRYLTGLFSENKVAAVLPFDNKTLKIEYTIRLKPNVVPAGEKVSCWMPYPRINKSRLQDVELLSVSEPEYIIAPEECLQRSLYMEKEVVRDSATEFKISYKMHTAAQWFDVQAENALSYDVESELYKRYTEECPPHIVFSDSVKNLARRIVGDEINPVEQVRLLYYWLNDNIPWAGALEYSVMDCIPEYVIKHRRGDCGMQTFLFLSMARSLGIPCKWQSGWYLLPEEKNLHDWAEVYYNGIGWVPVDPSFKLTDSPNIKIHEFYMNGLDSYRLIINDDFGQNFYPAKKFSRSEPYDFQRGELEWQGGNLYFDKWTYHMNVSYEN